MAKKNSRILITAARFFPRSYGGGEMYILSLAQELMRREHSVTVVTLAPWQSAFSGDAERENTEIEGVPVVALRFAPGATTEGEKYAVNHFLMRRSLKDVVREFSPDIIHINGINSAILMVAEELRLPTITTIHHSGIACSAGALVRPDNSLCSYAAHSSVCVPCCSMQRTPHWWTGGLLGRIPRWFYRPFGQRVDPVRNLPYIFRALRYPWLVEQTIEQMQVVWRLSRQFIAPSSAIKELLMRNGVNEERIQVLPHGIKPMQRSDIQFNGGRKVKFGYVGQFSRVKGIHLIIEALENLRGAERCELHFFGSAQGKEEEAYFLSLIKNYKGPASIVEHGYIKSDGLQDASPPSTCFSIRRSRTKRSGLWSTKPSLSDGRLLSRGRADCRSWCGTAKTVLSSVATTRTTSHWQCRSVLIHRNASSICRGGFPQLRQSMNMAMKLKSSTKWKNIVSPANKQTRFSAGK